MFKVRLNWQGFCDCVKSVIADDESFHRYLHSKFEGTDDKGVVGRYFCI